MSRFQFRRDAILRRAQSLVHREELQLARLLAQKSQLVIRLAELQSEEDQYSRRVQTMSSAGTDGAELAVSAAALSSYMYHALRVQAEMKRLAPLIEGQRARYIAAQREQEKLEKLRESEYAAWQQESKRREQQAADELFLLRFRHT